MMKTLLLLGCLSGVIALEAADSMQTKSEKPISYSSPPALSQIEVQRISQAQIVDDHIVQKIDAVLLEMQKFFFLTHDIARWKWNHDLPIEGGHKEIEMLEKLSQKGVTLGLQPHIVKEIFKAQLEASKMIQEKDFEQWTKEKIAQFGAVGDLKKQLRPKIEQICEAFLITLTEMLPLIRKSNLSEVIKWRSTIVLKEEGISDAVRDVALKPFIMLCAQVSMK